MAEGKLDRMFARACAIEAGKANGLYLPNLRALARRKFSYGMLGFANWLDVMNPERRRTAFLMLREVSRMGHSLGAQNIAMSHFNRGNLAGYRQWLAKAARLGDENASLELRCFEVRLSHSAAFKIGRGRPSRKHENFATRRPF